jgi:peptidoglycan/LPS O-acetylase OafA/YrhL
LSVELAFYMCMLVIWRTGLNPRIEGVLGAWIALKWLWWMLPGFAPKLALLLVANHIPYFAVGMVSYRIWSGQRQMFEQLPLLAFTFATVLLTEPREAHWVISGLIASFLLLAAGNLKWVACRALVRLGAISYPLYLVHAAIGYSIIVRLEASGVSPTLATIVALTATSLIASAIARITEWPAPFARGLTLRSLDVDGAASPL